MITFNHITGGQRWIDANVPREDPSLIPADIEIWPEPKLSDEEVIQLCQSFKTGPKFNKLYFEGDISDHGDDDSSADLSLTNLITFVSRSVEQIDRIYRGSALMRDKWDSRRGLSTYGLNTILKSLKDVTNNYSSSSKPREILDKFEEAYDTIFRYQWDNYTQPLHYLAVLDNAKKKGWGYDEKGVLTFTASRDIKGLVNLSHGAISGNIKDFTFRIRYPIRVVEKGYIAGATRLDATLEN